MLRRACLFAGLILFAVPASAWAECYVNLTGGAAGYGISRAGPFSSMSACQSFLARNNLDATCSCSGPSPEELWRIQQQNQIHAHVAEGNRLFEERRYEDAIRSYEQALAVGPSEAATNNITLARYSIAIDRARAAWQVRDYDGAIAAYRQALSYQPKDPASIEDNIRRAYGAKAFLRGNELFDKDDWDGAIAAYRETLSYVPDHESAQRNIDAAEKNKANALIRQQNEQRRQQRESENRAAFENIQQGIDLFIASANKRKAAQRPIIAAGVVETAHSGIMQTNTVVPILAFGDVALLEQAHTDAGSGFDFLGGFFGPKPSPPVTVPSSDLSAFERIPAVVRSDPRVDPMIAWYKRLAAERNEVQRELASVQRDQKNADDASRAQILATQLRRIEAEQRTAKGAIAAVARNSYGKEWNEEGAPQ